MWGGACVYESENWSGLQSPRSPLEIKLALQLQRHHNNSSHKSNHHRQLCVMFLHLSWNRIKIQYTINAENA